MQTAGRELLAGPQEMKFLCYDLQAPAPVVLLDNLELGGREITVYSERRRSILKLPTRVALEPEQAVCQHGDTLTGRGNDARGGSDGVGWKGYCENMLMVQSGDARTPFFRLSWPSYCLRVDKLDQVNMCLGPTDQKVTSHAIGGKYANSRGHCRHALHVR
jgi:hypothetical protein